MADNGYAIKTMVELSATEEEADRIIEEFTLLRGFGEKLKFLYEQFPNISILGGCDGEEGNETQTDYEAVLSVIVNSKWR
jgi:hypothetical protein